MPQSSRFDFLEKFLANNFALSHAADLTLLRTLLAICQKSQEPRFWEVMDTYNAGYVYIYINSNLNLPTKLTSISRSTEFKDPMKHLSETVPISMRIVISYVIKWGIPLLV